jgi:hypothetical protein
MNKTRVTALTTIGSSVGPKGTVDQVKLVVVRITTENRLNLACKYDWQRNGKS